MTLRFTFVAALVCASMSLKAQSPSEQSGPRVEAPKPSSPRPEQSVPEASSSPRKEKGTDQSATGGGSMPIPATVAQPSYVIGTGDVLFVRVWNNGNLTGMVNVRPDGMLSLPLVGEIHAEGQTVAQLVDTLTKRLGEFLNNPEVDVQLTRINSKRIFIMGEVARSGEFPLTDSMTVLDALSGAGGFKEFANTKKIYVLRGDKKFYFNYKDVRNGKHMEQNIKLQNGDYIFVP